MLRITGGEFRGRFLKTPKTIKVRPTQARLRQALFNSIQHSLSDAAVLDLFAGSGALGFEALSRGASSVVFVELDRGTAKLISDNARELGVSDRIRIISDSVEGAMQKIGHSAPYGIVLADPPYEGGFEQWLLEKPPWASWLARDGVFCLEWGINKSVLAEMPERAPFLVKIREKIYGDSVLTTYGSEPAHE